MGRRGIAAARERHRQRDHAPCRECERIEPLAEQEPRHQRRDRRYQIEQPATFGRAVAQQPVQAG